MPSPSIFQITSPCKFASLNKDFHIAQQTWLQLATTPSLELTADSSLAMLVGSAQLVQQSPVTIIYLYALVFDSDAMLMLPKPTQEMMAGMSEVWTVPHQGMLVSDVVDGKMRIREAANHFLRDELGVHCKPASAYLMKAVLPISRGPIVAAVVRLNVDRRGLQASEIGRAGKWFTRQQLEELNAQDMYPEGLKQLIMEAFEQKQFESDVFAE